MVMVRKVILQYSSVDLFRMQIGLEHWQKKAAKWVGTKITMIALRTACVQGPDGRACKGWFLDAVAAPAVECFLNSVIEGERLSSCLEM